MHRMRLTDQDELLARIGTLHVRCCAITFQSANFKLAELSRAAMFYIWLPTTTPSMSEEGSPFLTLNRPLESIQSA